MTSLLRYIKGLTARGVLNWLVFAVCCVAITRACLAERKYDKLISSVRDNPPKESPVIQEAEEIAREADSVGKERVVFRLSEPIIKKIEDNARVDSFAQEAGIKDLTITSLTKINAEFKKLNTDLKREIQTLENGNRDTVWRYADPWLSFDASWPSDTVFRLNKMVADASVNRVDHDRRKYWGLGRTENLTTVWFDSPYIRVGGMETLRIRQKEPLFDFNLSVEGRHIPDLGQTFIGPKATLKIGRFNINGGYQFNINPARGQGSSLWYGGEYVIY